jgi:hypothetical protein
MDEELLAGDHPMGPSRRLRMATAKKKKPAKAAAKKTAKKAKKK